MKNFIQTIKNIWSIEELRNKIGITLSLMVIYRFAAQVTLQTPAEPFTGDPEWI